MATNCTTIQQSLAWCQGTPELPGIKRRIYYISKDQMVNWPTLQHDTHGRLTSAVYNGNFELAADATWKFIDILPDKSQLTSEAQGEYPSQTQLNKLTAVHPGVGVNASALAAYVNNCDCVFLVETVRGRYRVVGSEKWQVKSTVAQDLGQGATGTTSTNVFGQITRGAITGSGFIISENGYIVTNYHVVENSTSIKVTTYNGQAYDATLVGYDESNDVAVLKIDATGLTPVTMGSSENLNVGDEVVAIGNPLGELTFSLTKGNVSAKDREVTLSANVTMNLIQTDAAINSGNSGGALFNMYGEVVGITNAKYSGSASGEASIDNIGFAIPLDSVKTIITDIIEKGYASKPYIGVQLAEAADAALIYSVTPGSPAEQAGLQANDIVTAANGEKVTCADDLTAIVKAMEPGDVLTLTVTRGGQETEIKVTVGEQPQTAAASEEGTVQGGSRQSGRSGSDGSGSESGGANDGYEGYGDYGDFGDFFGFPFGGSGEYYRG